MSKKYYWTVNMNTSLCQSTIYLKNIIGEQYTATTVFSEAKAFTEKEVDKFNMIGDFFNKFGEVEDLKETVTNNLKNLVEKVHNGDKKYYWFFETDEIGELINAGLVKLWYAGENSNGTSKLSTDINKAVALSQDEILDHVGSDLECYWRHEIADPGAVGIKGPEGSSVNSPKHYNENGLETIDAIKGTMSREAFHGFCTGNILKYVARFKFKNGIEDLKKARWYLDKMIEDEERGEDNALK